MVATSWRGWDSCGGEVNARDLRRIKGELRRIKCELCRMEGELCRMEGELCKMEGELCGIKGELCGIWGRGWSAQLRWGGGCWSTQLRWMHRNQRNGWESVKSQSRPR